MDSRHSNDKRMTLAAAVKHIKDGDVLCFSGMGGGQCVAHSYEIARQGQKGLTLIGDSPCDAADILVGTGQIDVMEIGYCAHALAGLGYNFRRAVEKKIPHPVRVLDYSNYTIGLRFLAGAMNVPFMPTKSLLGSDIGVYNPDILESEDPYTNEKVALVPAAHPDVAIVHVNRADKRGNGQMFGYSSNAENMARSAKYTILTCEELVGNEEIRKNPCLTLIPEYCVDAVVELRFACHPWNFPYAYIYDLPFHADYIKAIRTREGFEAWMKEWCYDTGSHEGYLQKVGGERLQQLEMAERQFCVLNY